jgi:hypothetical protein
VNPAADLARAWRGLALTVAGRPEAANQFDRTARGLVIALGWLVLALILSAAAQSAVVGIPNGVQVATGLFIQAVTVAALAAVAAQSLRFLKLGVPLAALFVPMVYCIALVQVLAIPLVLVSPPLQLFAVLVLGLLIWRVGHVLGGMPIGVAIAFALLCLMVLVVVPNALYMLLLVIPSPA